ncbi:MAG: MFS transporter [Gammaproteobacteria bacterium]|nr:MFS transporter [Gammaproteobacteria bacterium]
MVAAFITQFIAVGMQNYIVGPFLTPMTEEFGWSRAEFTAARSIGQMMMAFTGFAIGTYIDRFGGRPFIIVGSLLLSISVYSLGSVQTLSQWLILNGVSLTAGAAMIGNLVVNVTLGKWFVEQRGKAVALAAMGVSLSGILLPPLATWLVDGYGWREAWHLLGVAVLFIAMPTAVLVRRAPEDYALHPDGKTAEQVAAGHGARAQADFDASMTRHQAMRTSRFYVLVLAFGLFQVSITVMLLQTIPFMTDAGFSRLTAASMLSLASLPAFLSKPVWGLLIDRYSARLLASLGAAITGFSVMLIVVSVGAQQQVLAYLGFLLMGVGWGGLIPLQEVIWASFFGRRYLGSVRSMAMPFSFALSALGPIVVAYYYDRVGNYDLALLAIAMCNLASAVTLAKMSEGNRALESQGR